MHGWQHVRHREKFNVHLLQIKTDKERRMTRTLKHVLLAGIQTPPQEAVCASRSYSHQREHIMDYNPFTLSDLELLIHQTAM